MKKSISILTLSTLWSMGLFAQSDLTNDAWEDNNSNVIVSSTSANVGIGTVTPTNKLHIIGADMMLERSTGTVTNQMNALRISITSTPGLTGTIGAGSINFIRTAVPSNPSITPDMTFSANGTAYQMIIKNNGNIGIGTTTVNDRLSVAGALGFSGTTGAIKGNMSSTTTDEFEIMGGSTLANGSYMTFRSTNAANPNGPGSIALISNGVSDGSKGIEFVNYNISNSQWEPLGRITRDGRMGIGTGLGTPVSRMELAGSQTGNNKNIILTLTNKWLANASNEPTLKFWNGDASSNNNVYWNIGGKVAAANNIFSIAYKAANSTTDNAIFKINGDGVSSTGLGQVQIGGESVINGTHTDYRLAVDGKIVSKETVIQVTGWADYVFGDDYKLADLQEVKKYISQNHHLPNIPSESEMVADGLAVAKTITLQQEKVEEIFLYMIQLEERLKTLETERK